MRAAGAMRCGMAARTSGRFACLSSGRSLAGTSLSRGVNRANTIRSSTASVLVVEAKKGDSVKKRQRQSEKARLYNRGRKSACKTRIKKVMASVEAMSEDLPKAESDLKPVDELIALAYKELDRAVAKGVMHKNTAARRKARVARARRDLAVTAGLYTP